MMKKRLGGAASIRLGGAASIVYNDTLWITGGLEKNPYTMNEVHDSSEYILSSGKSVVGPKLPMKMVGHAMVNINRTSTIFIGGNLFSLGWYFGQFQKR